MILLLLIIAQGDQGDDDHRGNDQELAIDDGIKIAEMVYWSNRSMNIKEDPSNDAVETLHNRNLSKLNVDMHMQKLNKSSMKVQAQSWLPQFILKLTVFPFLSRCLVKRRKF